MQGGRCGQADRNATLRACLGLLIALLLISLTLILAVLSYVKSISRCPNEVPAQLQVIVSTVVNYLKNKTLWELVPTFQIEHPFGTMSVSFWIYAGLLVFAGKLAIANRFHLRGLGRKAKDAADAFWRTPFMCSGPVTNYTVLFNGPVTTQQVVQISTGGTEFDRVAEDLEKLMNAIAKDSKLPEEKKKDAQDLLRTITEEAKLPEDKRKPAVVKAVLQAIPLVISAAKSLLDLWTEIQPHVISFFHS